MPPISEPTPLPQAAPATGRRPLLWWYGLASLLAVFTYFYALDSDHIPKNGDEYPYAHITRLTAQSGHLLPLQSELQQMRNTKPPLLFWQGIASTHWGRDWTWWHLRYPSVLYTLLTALLVLLVAWKLSAKLETGFLALLCFLAFFGTFRYGRPFLTDPPEVFWLFVPWFVLLYWPRASASRGFFPLGLGLLVGVGLLYKSFALAVPVSLALAWWWWRQRHYRLGPFLVHDVPKVALLALVSLALFSLWFVLDPDPRALFHEFVLGENMGKLAPGKSSYLAHLLWGDSSIWRVAVSYPLNAGLLAVPVVALGWLAWRRRAELSEGESLLWIWVGTLFVFFSLPSQRDERYLLPGMPALAVLCALNWHRFNRKVLLAALVPAGAILAGLAWLSLRLEQGLPGVPVYPLAYWLLLFGSGVLVLLALVRPRLTAPGLLVVVLLVSLCLSAFMRPLDGPRGHFSAEACRSVQGKAVWVPTNFRAKEEGHRFLLPGADPHPYPARSGLDVAALSARYPLFIIRLPLNAADPTGVKVLGQRLDLGSRHSASQIRAIVQGQVYENLFLKELLVEAPGPAAAAPAAR